MTPFEPHSAVVPAELRLLTFTVSGIKIGVDTDQISEILGIEAAEEQGLRICRLNEKISYRGMAAYRSPKVITIKGGEAGHALMIDMPDDLLSAPIASIRPLPPLVRTTRFSKAFWGAVIMENEPVLLMDLSLFCFEP